MKPPPPKKARALGASDDGIRQIVAQALLSDDASCAALLERLNGFEKEVFDALMTILRTFSASKVNLHGPISKILKKYFAVIGVGTASERFNELCDAVLHNVGTEYAASFVFLLCQFINFCNILRYDKLCRDVIGKLPSVIRTLWTNGLRAEACLTSRLFVELLLSVSCYHGDESFLEVWFEQVLTEELKRCPYFAVLSHLLISQNRHPFVDSINFADLQELPREGEHLSLRTQVADLILTYLPSLHSRCTERQLQAALDFVLRHGFETKNVSCAVGKLIDCAGAMADDTLICQLAADSIIRLILEQLSASTSGCSLSIVQHQQAPEKAKQRISEDLSSSIYSFLDRSLKKKSAFKTNVRQAVEPLVDAFCILPLRSTAGSSVRHYLAATVLFANIFKSDGKLFPVCIRKMIAFARSDENTILSPAASSLIEAFLDICLDALEGLSIAAEIWRDVATAWSIFAVSIKGKDVDDIPHRLCPVLDFMESSAPYTWAWRDVVRLSVLFTFTKWELLEGEEEQQRMISEKIRTLISSAMASVVWKDEDGVRRGSERWSILFSCWEYIPRGVRIPIMKRLLNEKNLDFLRKLSRRIIVGKVEVDRVVLESALNFYLKYIPSLIEEPRQLEEILDWNALLYLQRAGVSLDVALAHLSVGKVVELLRFCSANVDHPHDTLHIVARMLSSRLKIVAGDILESLASIFDKCVADGNVQLLSVAANALEVSYLPISLIYSFILEHEPASPVFGHTDVERDVTNLCFALVSVQSLNSPDFTHLRSVQRVLDNAIRYAHPSVNNDQCAVFSQFLIKVFKAVQNFITNQYGTAEQVDELVHGLHSLAHALTIHKIYYSRIVGTILSAVMYQLEEIEFALYKLHSISDKHRLLLMLASLAYFKLYKKNRKKFWEIQINIQPCSVNDLLKFTQIRLLWPSPVSA
ncbi:hypothetical protein Y032_0190g1262 [Ancylostoma ceylanicum]|nr:hypothetical protein Y032_0190g1262 [Ancylostoma ceylanicum]